MVNRKRDEVIVSWMQIKSRASFFTNFIDTKEKMKKKKNEKMRWILIAPNDF